MSGSTEMKPTPISCRFGFHDWYSLGTYFSVEPRGHVKARIWMQKRKCADCGKTEAVENGFWAWLSTRDKEAA